MPFVEVHIWKEHASDSVKEKLIKEISEKVSEILGAPLEIVEVIIDEVPKSGWGKGGAPASKWGKSK